MPRKRSRSSSSSSSSSSDSNSSSSSSEENTKKSPLLVEKSNPDASWKAAQEATQKDIKLKQKFNSANPFDPKQKAEAPVHKPINTAAPVMIEVIVNNRMGVKARIKCLPDDTIGDLKKLISAQTGTKSEKIKLQKYHTVYKDHITLGDYEIKDGTGLEMYYN